MADELDAPPENGLETWTSWEVEYDPLPRLRSQEGFDKILTRISDAIDGDDRGPLRRWGEVGVVGRFQRTVVFDVEEPKLETWERRSPVMQVMLPKPGDFQDDVGRFVAGLGLEGNVYFRRVFTTMRPTLSVSEDGD